MPDNVEIQLECTLEQLYNGCTKTLQYSAFMLNDDKQTLVKTERQR